MLQSFVINLLDHPIHLNVTGGTAEITRVYLYARDEGHADEILRAMFPGVDLEKDFRPERDVEELVEEQSDFKVGDRVRVDHSPLPDLIGATGGIVDFGTDSGGGRHCLLRLDGSNRLCSFRESSLAKISD